MSADLRTISNFCFAWVTVYVMTRLFHAVLLITEHIVRASFPQAIASRMHKTWSLAIASALTHLTRGALVALPLGVVTLVVARLIA